MSNTELRLREATPVETISRALNLFHEYVKDHAEGSTRNHHRDIFGRAVLALSALAAPETGDGREGTSVVLTPCEHEWHIRPEIEQKCGKCGCYRNTPGQDKFWLKLPSARAVVLEQAGMESLWCAAEHIFEDHLQQELRRLHEAVEREAAFVFQPKGAT